MAGYCVITAFNAVLPRVNRKMHCKLVSKNEKNSQKNIPWMKFYDAPKVPDENGSNWFIFCYVQDINNRRLLAEYKQKIDQPFVCNRGHNKKYLKCQDDRYTSRAEK